MQLKGSFDFYKYLKKTECNAYIRLIFFFLYCSDSDRLGIIVSLLQHTKMKMRLWSSMPAWAPKGATIRKVKFTSNLARPWELSPEPLARRVSVSHIHQTSKKDLCLKDNGEYTGLLFLLSDIQYIFP